MKRIISFLLVILMLVSLIPADLAYAMEGEKLDVVPLSDGQHMIKLPEVDYTSLRSNPNLPTINPTDNPDAFYNMNIKVDIHDLVLQATGVKSVTVTVKSKLANYSQEYTVSKDKFGKAFEAPVPITEYVPVVLVKFDDGRDSRYIVEAKSKPTNTTEINIDFLGHTGVATRWFGKGNRPDVKANFVGINKTKHLFDLPKVDQNTVLRSPSNRFQWRGHDNIVLLPVVPEADIRVGEIGSAKTIHFEIQDALQGQLAGSNYYYQITGESYTHRGFTATMREKNTVNFEAGDGTWKNAKPAKQFAANGLKLSDKFMEAPDTIGPVTVPNGESDLTPPKAQAGKPENEFKGWATTKGGSVVDMDTYVVTGDTTFYAIYGPKDQGKVTIQYVDESGTAIKDTYKIKGVDYPAEATGNFGENVDASKIPEPKFIGYERNGDINVTGIKYLKNGGLTVEVPYKKLDSIIPENEANKDVKKTYTPVTFAADTSKGKLKLGDADGGAKKVYYVNPVEGQTIENVKAKYNITAEGNEGVYKVDETTPWKFAPDEVSSLNTVITTTPVTVNANFVKEKGTVTYEYKYVNNTTTTDPSIKDIPVLPTDATQYEVNTKVTAETTVAKDKTVTVKDQSDTTIGTWKFSGWNPATLDIKKGENKFTGTWTFTESLASILKGKLSKQDIKVWKGDVIDWEKGVEKDETGLTPEQINLIKNEFTHVEKGQKVDGKAKFVDATTPGRNSDAVNVKPFVGNIKVTFSDGSELLVKDQKLYVSDHMTGKDNKNAPENAVTVQFLLGKGVKAKKDTEYIEGAEPAMLYETYKVKPNLNLDNYMFETNKTIFGTINPEVTNDKKFSNVVWSPTDHVVKDNNNKFIATATEAHLMKHEFKLLDKDNKDAEITPVPKTIQDLLPIDVYKNKGDKYTPDKPMNINAAKEADNKFYDYKFKGWEPEKIDSVQKDEKFVGTWTRKQSQSNKPIVNKPVKPGDKKITGKGDPGSDIEVVIPNPENPNNPTKITTPVKPDGTWEAEVPKGKEPKDKDVITVTQTEKGKTPSEKVKVTVEKEKPTPSGPSGPSRPSTPNPTPSTPDRVHGKDRVETAIDISKKYFGKANTVIVVDRKDFPDAMTASVLSKLLKAPILLTDTNKLDSRVAAEIQRLGAKDVIVVGGNKSVSEAVKKELAKFDKDTVERIYGKDRYETSAQVARRVVGITGKLGHGVVASGQVFADALTVAPYASREGYPILLVRANNLPKPVKDAITELAINKVTIAGGYTTVNKSLEASLPTVAERLSGRTRYETAIDIATKKFNTNKIFLANGEHWMDALVIGPVGGILDMPILLTQANSAPQSLKDYIAKERIQKITAIGGTSMVSDRVLNELSK